jgi:excisionase family DNA binding protein
MKAYNLEEVAEMLGLSVVTIRRYIKSGKLKASKIGKQWRVLEREVMELYESNLNNK